MTVVRGGSFRQQVVPRQPDMLELPAIPVSGVEVIKRASNVRRADRFKDEDGDKSMTDPKNAGNSPRFDRRPWGSFTVLDEGEGYKVKRIEVLSGKRLSYQKHTQRAEHWVVVQGSARVTLDGREIEVAPGGAIDVPLGAMHRIENAGTQTLIFIEVQRGNYLGEDDIIRFQDDYGRQEPPQG